MIRIKPSPELHAMLGELLKKAPRARAGDHQAQLVRNRAAQQLLAAKAQQAAECAWPGFTSLFRELLRQEAEHMRKAGPQC